jgi:restriction endonuclease S subunit
VIVIQPKDISSEGGISLNDLCRVSVTNAKPLKKGDVLLTSRGRFTAVAFDLDGDDDYTVPASIIIMTVKVDWILPEYVALYLNSASGQTLLKRHLETTTVPFIRCSNLQKITIPVPALEKQRVLAKFDAEHRRYGQLTSRKLELHKQILNHTLGETDE